jgi:hypothetical protein
MMIVPKEYYPELWRFAAEAGHALGYDKPCILEALGVVVEAGLSEHYDSYFVTGAMVVMGAQSVREVPLGLFIALTLEEARSVSGWTFLAPALPDSGAIDDSAALGLLASALALPANDNEAVAAMYPLTLTAHQSLALRAFAERHRFTERTALAVVLHIGLRSARKLISDEDNAAGA